MTTRRNIDDLPESLMAFINEEHAEERDDLVRVWSACGSFDPYAAVDRGKKAAVRSYVLNMAEQARRQAVPRSSIGAMRLFRSRAFAVAASVVLLIGVAFALSPASYSYRAPVGDRSSFAISLPDGSSAILAPGSRLSYSSRYGKGVRRVSLVGEAFFEVRKGNGAFVVDTYNTRATVLGTRFSVRAWPSEIEASTDVTVSEGRVQVSPLRGGAWQTTLEPSESASVAGKADQAADPEKIDTDFAFSWLGGGYGYRNEPIGNVLDDLHRRYGQRLEAPAEILLRPISIFNQSEVDLESILGDISATMGVKYRKISGGFEFYVESANP